MLVYLFPLARLWVRQSIWQFSSVVAPPWLQASTRSASISFSPQSLVRRDSCPAAHNGQLLMPRRRASSVCRLYTRRLVASSNTRTSNSRVSSIFDMGRKNASGGKILRRETVSRGIAANPILLAQRWRQSSLLLEAFGLQVLEAKSHNYSCSRRFPSLFPADYTECCIPWATIQS